MTTRKSFIALLMLVCATAAFAIPARRGQWLDITLADGRQVRAELRGDEHFHYFTDADGNAYVCDALTDTYFPATADQVARSSAAARQRRTAGMPKRRALNNKETTLFHGAKKGLIILVQFSDLEFQPSHDLELYNSIINERGYSSHEGFVGSVRDYFYDQSGGQFDLSFDVVGPVTMPNSYSYYGRDSGGEGNDAHPGQMVAEACMAIDDEIDFSNYDWDGDGEVDEVYVLYAGHGQADYYYRDTKVIWPHMFSLSASDYGRKLRLDGVAIDVYACSNEISASNKLAGIGTFCHEFSHCMGFPDMYDTMGGYSTNFGMGSWDLMDSGSYNGDMFVPAGYSAYEKWECGWIEPVELASDTTVADMRTLYDGGEAYIIYNKAYPDEIYILENRQLQRWDAELPAAGMLIQYVDYDPILWEYNVPNGWESTVRYSYGINNDHQRITIFHADNSDNNEAGDTYPYRGNNSLTNTSRPAAKVWHRNTDGSMLMNIAVTDITLNADGTMAFNFKKTAQTDDPDDPDSPDNPDPLSGDDDEYDVVFYESFDKCAGRGGNDDLFSGSVAVDAFLPDYEGWYNANGEAYGADACARFGSREHQGVVTSPAFELEGEGELLFKAAPWGIGSTDLSIAVNGDATLGRSVFTMWQGQWTDYLVTLNTTDPDTTQPDTTQPASRRGEGKKTLTLTFTPGGRFFLDEVIVRQKKSTSPVVDGIRELTHSHPSDSSIYSIDGRCVGTQTSRLRPGLYIVNGRKVVVR